MKWRIGWGYLGSIRRSGSGWEWLKRGFKKTEELVWVWVEGEGSESANSTGVSTLALLHCEIV